MDPKQRLLGPGRWALPNSNRRERDERICGLEPFSFWTFLFIVVLLLVGGAVVGGVFGGIKASQKSNPSPSTATAAPTNNTPTGPVFPAAQ